MERPENDKWLDEALTAVIGSTGTRADFKQWKQKHPQAVEMLTARAGDEALASPGSHKIRRTILKSPITKLAAAAAIIVAVLVGITLFDSSATSVVWAEVAQKVQASRGVIFRSRDDGLGSQDGGSDYIMNYLYSTQSRLDFYKGDQIIKTIYDDFNTKTVILVDHGHKSYIKKTFEQMEQNHLLSDPKSMVQRFLSHEHRELGPKTVEGVLCEGIETTDPAFDGTDYPVDSLMAQVWVSLETGYPVQIEIEIVRNNGQIRLADIVDQFQWDVELDESIFEPNIPADYMRILMP